MNFAEKLQFLMKISDTSNVQLAHALNVDPSLISRLKSGTRIMHKNSVYCQCMLSYFVAKPVFNNSVLKECEREKQLKSWLFDNTQSLHTAPFIQTISKLQYGFDFEPNEAKLPEDIQEPQFFTKTFYSVSGYFEAENLFYKVANQFSSVSHLKLLAQSTDKFFNVRSINTQISKKNLYDLVSKAKKVSRIVPNIYTYSMLQESLNEWFQFYLTGKVYAYYSPFLSDNIISHSIAVIPEKIALYTCHFDTNVSQVVTFVTTDPKVVNGINQIFENYLYCCSPCIELNFISPTPQQFLQKLQLFCIDNKERIAIHGSLPITCTSIDEIKSLYQAQLSQQMSEIIAFHSTYYMQFHSLAKQNAYTEVFPLAEVNELFEGKINNAFLSSVMQKEIYYTPLQYYNHLKNILHFLFTNPQYNIVIDDSYKNRHTLLLKEGELLFSISNAFPSALCDVTYMNFVSATWHFKASFVRSKLNEPFYRAHVTNLIINLMENIKQKLEE